MGTFDSEGGLFHCDFEFTSTDTTPLGPHSRLAPHLNKEDGHMERIAGVCMTHPTGTQVPYLASQSYCTCRPGPPHHHAKKAANNVENTFNSAGVTSPTETADSVSEDTNSLPQANTAAAVEVALEEPAGG